jgi:hypothetical protein
MKLFDKYGYKFTLWMVARSAEVTGFYPRLLAEKGHEVGRCDVAATATAVAGLQRPRRLRRLRLGLRLEPWLWLRLWLRLWLWLWLWLRLWPLLWLCLGLRLGLRLSLSLLL